MTAQRPILISDVVSQSNDVTTLEKRIILREAEGKVSCKKIAIGQEKEEKRTMVKALAVENVDKVKNFKTEKARNEGSIEG